MSQPQNRRRIIACKSKPDTNKQNKHGGSLCPFPLGRPRTLCSHETALACVSLSLSLSDAVATDWPSDSRCSPVPHAAVASREDFLSQFFCSLLSHTELSTVLRLASILFALFGADVCSICICFFLACVSLSVCQSRDRDRRQSPLRLRGAWFLFRFSHSYLFVRSLSWCNNSSGIVSI